MVMMEDYFFTKKVLETVSKWGTKQFDVVTGATQASRLENIEKLYLRIFIGA
jgi:hypothetical protein